MLGSIGPGPFRSGVPVSHQAEEMETHPRVEGQHQNASCPRGSVWPHRGPHLEVPQEPSTEYNVGQRERKRAPAGSTLPRATDRVPHSLSVIADVVTIVPLLVVVVRLYIDPVFRVMIC